MTGRLNKLTGLWPAKSGRGYTGGLREEVTLPAGARLVLCKIPEDDRKPNGPHLELLWSEPQGATASFDHDERRGGKVLDQAAVDAAVRSQAPSPGTGVAGLRAACRGTR